MRDAGLCGSCHTLYTTAHWAEGEKLAKFRSKCLSGGQHSDSQLSKPSGFHMPVVKRGVAIMLVRSAREGMHRMYLFGSNFPHGRSGCRIISDDLATEALPEEMDARDEAHAGILEDGRRPR